MVKGNLLLTAFGALILGCVLVVPMHKEVNTLHTNSLTFSGPVALPGVTLSAGTYVFGRAVRTACVAISPSRSVRLRGGAAADRGLVPAG